MVNSPIGVDMSLTADQQMRLAREVHQSELALANDLAQAELQYRIEQGEAKRRRGHAIEDAQAKHREAISQTQLAQLAYRLAADAAGQED